MRKKLIFMFSGQGSQYYQMGKEFFNGEPVFRNWMLKLDGLVQKRIHHSVIDHIYDEKNQKADNFNRTLLSHPAIFMVQYSLAKTLLSKGMVPDYLLGSSLGEFVAAALSDALTVEDTLELVLQHAQIFENRCEKGCMLAVLGDLRTFTHSLQLQDVCELAGINFDGHYVITTQKRHLEKVNDYFDKKNIPCIELPVSFGYHSSLIADAEDDLKNSLCNITCRPPTISVISSTLADFIYSFNQFHLATIARKPLLFQKTIQHLETLGYHHYIDVGPSGTLATFVKYNLNTYSASQIHTIMTLIGDPLNNFERLFKKLAICDRRPLSLAN